ncbi:MAG: HAMP domain-containing histidine kinase [Candidatus Thermoplasmatota archaeon]|nr:HAMP domain-containing histidine kinase [Candidatus Thermoplasmatota archaeon]
MQNNSAKTKTRQAVEACPTPPRFAGEMLSVLTYIMKVEHLDRVLQKIASAIADLFSVRSMVIGVLDESEQIFRVRATYGYEGDKDRNIKKFTYSHERMKTDLEDKYKIGEGVYLIRPNADQFIKGEESFYRNMQNITKPRTDPSIWHELDYLRFVLSNREGVMIGFLEVNDVADDRIPDSATVEAMQIFSQLAAVAIENATVYQRQVEIAQRSKFLGDNIGHDINNFNQAVTSYLELARSTKGVPEKAANYMERASSSAWGISELIQRANKLIKIEQEGAENLGPLDLGEVLKEIIAEVSRSVDEKEVKFDLKVGNHRYFVMGNELADEIFTNILRNAVEYDPHDKIIVDVSIGEFTVEPRRYWCVSVADNGIGIPDSKKNIVFGRFNTGDERPPATGLGLSIVRAIVEAYHGMVWVEDRVPGDPSKGSVFRVALPMASAK